MSNIHQPSVRRDAEGGRKRLWRAVPIVAITAAAVGAAVIGGVAGPASSATAQQPAHSAWVSSASGADANAAVTRYVTLSGGKFTLNTAAAEKAGISSQAVLAESTVVAGLNKELAHDNATAGSGNVDAFRSYSLNVKDQAAAASTDKSTTITVVPGITLTISDSGLVINMTKAAVTELTNVAGFAKDVTAVVTTAITNNPAVIAAISAAAVAITGNPAAVITGPMITAAGAFVSSAIGLATDVLKICTASDGTATFTIPWFGLPSCSAGQ